jgi:hypothetical protein
MVVGKSGAILCRHASNPGQVHLDLVAEYKHQRSAPQALLPLFPRPIDLFSDWKNYYTGILFFHHNSGYYGAIKDLSFFHSTDNNRPCAKAFFLDW